MFDDVYRAATLTEGRLVEVTPISALSLKPNDIVRVEFQLKAEALPSSFNFYLQRVTRVYCA